MTGARRFGNVSASRPIGTALFGHDALHVGLAARLTARQMFTEGGESVNHVVEPLRIAGFTRVPHIEMIARVRDAIGSSGGFILDSYMFSNALLSISFEIHARDVESLATAISMAGLRFDAQSTSRLAGWDAETIGPDFVLPGALSINFVHDDPPLRIEVPAVPG